MFKGFREAQAALCAIERQARETREMMHETMIDPRLVYKLLKDIQGYIFYLAVAEITLDGVPVGKEYYNLVDEAKRQDGDPPVAAPAVSRFPEQIILVNRRWRNIGLGTARMWTRIICDPKHPLERTVRWSARSQQALLSVQWARHAKELPLLLLHLLCV
ncbi:hypothetical protein FRB93_007786 [Tulasnella sp. JGI-2019a]|nr:hypothetical protein FRB93_007786 [Tulasnella sp. JGI-2019a]